MSDQEQPTKPPTPPPPPSVDIEEESQVPVQQQQENNTNENNNSEPKKEGEGEEDGEGAEAEKKKPERRKVNTALLGNLVSQTVISNLPAGQRPIPEWKRKALEKEALARGETLPPPEEGAELYRPPHQRIPPAPLVSQQAQERSAFPGDFWFHKEIENLISKHRRKVHIKENEDDPFYDRGGKAGRGVIASYIVDGYPLVRNARPKHIREQMTDGGIYPDNAAVTFTRPGFGGLDENGNPMEENFDEDEPMHEVQIGGGVDQE